MARQLQDDGIALVGVSSRDDRDAMQTFVDRHGVDVIPHVVDEEGFLRSRLGVLGQPNWWFVDGGTGRVEKVAGFLSPGGLRARLDALARL